MASVSKDLEKVFRIVLRELIEEHPLFRLKYFGYDGYIHQAELFYKLAIRQPVRVLVADEIGLGKTIEALTLIEWGLRKGVFPNGRVLILVPRSLIGQVGNRSDAHEATPDYEHRGLRRLHASKTR